MDLSKTKLVTHGNARRDGKVRMSQKSHSHSLSRDTEMGKKNFCLAKWLKDYLEDNDCAKLKAMIDTGIKAAIDGDRGWAQVILERAYGRIPVTFDAETDLQMNFVFTAASRDLIDAEVKPELESDNGNQSKLTA